jgi:hypothetical protein
LDANISISDKHDYFRFALDQIKIFPLYEILSKASIVPSRTKYYTINDMNDAIQNTTGVLPGISCNSDGIIESVTICFSRELNLQDCIHTSKCSTNRLKYPD